MQFKMVPLLPYRQNLTCLGHSPTLVLLVQDMPCLYSVDQDQLASSEANSSGSALFVSQYVYLHQQPSSNNLIG